MKARDKSARLALICSSGGHFLQLYSLQEFWRDHDHFWVTFDKPDTNFLLKEEVVCHAFSPTNRNIINLVRNFIAAFGILRQKAPGVLISTGAGLAVPYIYAAWIMGIKTVYIESITRVKGLSLSGRMVYPVVDEFIVQWPELAAKLGKAKFIGQVI